MSIIGAEVRNDIGYVYFVDPNDPSDSADLTKQRIYAIPYKTLRENICTTDGRFGRAPNGARAYIRPRQQGGNCYAVHGEKPSSFSLQAPQKEKE